jgi:hypothetical protein
MNSARHCLKDVLRSRTDIGTSRSSSDADTKRANHDECGDRTATTRQKGPRLGRREQGGQLGRGHRAYGGRISEELDEHSTQLGIIAHLDFREEPVDGVSHVRPA